MLRAALLSAVLILPAALPGAAAAQDADTTLADIKQELAVLLTEIESLKRELSTTGTPQMNLQGTSALQRIDAMEAELRRLTGDTEEMTNRVNRIVTDGTNRIGDLQFRVCELEEGCDIGALGETKPLGGEAGTVPAAAPPPPAAPSGPELAVGEQADFDRAKEALDSGSFRSAADLFKTFTETFTAGALTSQAHFYRGEALSQLGENAEAARAYLEAFSGAPEGEKAPEALLKLGLTLNTLGQQSDACAILGEVPTRFPESPASIEAQTARSSLVCG
ncbi:tol-pal system protein YbgF [Oceaniglobus roseus]|uniref:tol-pal system protein YbgF n=1 Tax=Oceaniglobus roseus TaxID=1737570 RepID=UPI000C7E9E41|nr:tol-pal system protein YbgF [Kandeliimicrobium roseum]